MSYSLSGAPTRIVAAADLSNLKEHALKDRYGFFEVEFQGLKIFCRDLLSFYIAAKDIFLQQIYNFQLTTETPVVIDGGGHIGLFTLFVKSRLPKAQVTVFEPEELSLRLLRMNLEANGFTDVRIVEAGLFNEDKVMYFNPDGSDGSTISNDQVSTVSIPVQKLSPFLNQQVDFLKLNIEGAELEVINEIAPYLHRVNEMAIEYHGFPELGQRLHLILATLDKAGFRYMLHDFDNETNGMSKPPFYIQEDTRFFELIYARRLFQKKETQIHVSEEEPTSELTRTEPICREFGLSRGTPIDRFYIESFLAANRNCIRGRVLEIADNNYTLQFGSAVTQSDVLNAEPCPGATIVADLGKPESLPENIFDCIIFTQTIQCIYDYKSALQNLHRALKPGGSLLITASGISQISRFDMDRWGEFWRFTNKSLERVLNEHCKDARVEVTSWGNIAAAKAFLDGRSLEEMSRETLLASDADYQLMLTGRVVKGGEKHLTLPEESAANSTITLTGINTPHLVTQVGVDSEPTILLYHRVISDPVDSQLLSVTPENFEQQLQVLQRDYRILALEEMVDEVARGVVTQNTVTLTFDDGYFDNYEYALPLLTKYKVPATFFVATNFINANREFYWDALEHLLLLAKLPEQQLVIDLNESHSITLELATPEQRFESYEQLCALLKGEMPEAVEEFVKHLYQWAGVLYTARPTHRTMTLNELRALADSPLATIGVHTMNHVQLSSLPEALQRQEIAGARDFLQESLGRTISLMSYPWGSPETYTAETLQLCRELHFKAGIANHQGGITKAADTFAMPRRLVRNWNGNEFAAWLSGNDKDQWEARALQARELKLKGLGNARQESRPY